MNKEELQTRTKYLEQSKEIEQKLGSCFEQTWTNISETFFKDERQDVRLHFCQILKFNPFMHNVVKLAILQHYA